MKPLDELIEEIPETITVYADYPKGGVIPDKFYPQLCLEHPAPFIIPKKMYEAMLADIYETMKSQERRSARVADDE